MLPLQYRKAVLAHFRQKSEEKRLPLAMGQLTRRGLRAACVEICRDKYKDDDAPVLRTFFEGGENRLAFLKAIAHYPVDRFRPLATFLKEGNNPDDKVVELAAWLVGFQPRPYDPRINYDQLPNTISGNSQVPSAGIEIDPSPTDSDKITGEPPSPAVEAVENKKKRRKIIFAITITIALGMIIIWTRPGKPPAPAYIGRQACMYWNEDHYEPISCQPHGDTLVVPLDPNKLAHFRKITRPDTITTNAIGSVWYVRYRKEYEFYTGDGFHPIDPNLRLRPITEFIIRNHIRP